MSGSIVPVLACVLNQLCLSNDQFPFNSKESNSKFHALQIPAIGLKDYLERVAKYSGCSTECFVLALIYIDRIIQSTPNFLVNSYSIHRLLITSVLLAAKFFDDQYYNNAYYAKVGGVTFSEMNSLEVEFLFMLNFDLFVTSDTYKQYYDELYNHANNNPEASCGCSSVKVPPLILPFEGQKLKGGEEAKVSDESKIDEPCALNSGSLFEEKHSPSKLSPDTTTFTKSSTSRPTSSYFQERRPKSSAWQRPIASVQLRSESTRPISKIPSFVPRQTSFSRASHLPVSSSRSSTFKPKVPKRTDFKNEFRDPWAPAPPPLSQETESNVVKSDVIWTNPYCLPFPQPTSRNLSSSAAPFIPWSQNVRQQNPYDKPWNVSDFEYEYYSDPMVDTTIYPYCTLEPSLESFPIHRSYPESGDVMLDIGDYDETQFTSEPVGAGEPISNKIPMEERSNKTSNSNPRVTLPSETGWKIPLPVH